MKQRLTEFLFNMTNEEKSQVALVLEHRGRGMGLWASSGFRKKSHQHVNIPFSKTNMNVQEVTRQQISKAASQNFTLFKDESL